MKAILGHIRRNKLVFILLLFTVLNGFFGKTINEYCSSTFWDFLNYWFSKISWKNWENASVISTLIYAAFYYYKLFRNPEYEKVKRAHLGLVGLFLFIITVLSVVSTIQMNRVIYMAIICAISGIYCYIDYKLKTGDLELSYTTTLKYSDIPVSIAFLILLIYSAILNFTDPMELIKMEPFFGGAVAFQMILSNIIWSFTDDKVMDDGGTKANK